MTWIDLSSDILEVFASEAPTVLHTVINPRTRELTCPGLWVTTSPAIKRERDKAWRAANPGRVREHRLREFAKRREQDKNSEAYLKQLEYQRAYYARNKERIKARRRVQLTHT